MSVKHTESPHFSARCLCTSPAPARAPGGTSAQRRLPAGLLAPAGEGVTWEQLPQGPASEGRGRGRSPPGPGGGTDRTLTTRCQSPCGRQDRTPHSRGPASQAQERRLGLLGLDSRPPEPSGSRDAGSHTCSLLGPAAVSRLSPGPAASGTGHLCPPPRSARERPSGASSPATGPLRGQGQPHPPAAGRPLTLGLHAALAPSVLERLVQTLTISRCCLFWGGGESWL